MKVTYKVTEYKVNDLIVRVEKDKGYTNVTLFDSLSNIICSFNSVKEALVVAHTLIKALDRTIVDTCTEYGTVTIKELKKGSEIL